MDQLKFTLSSDLYKNIGAEVDVYFNDTNLLFHYTLPTVGQTFVYDVELQRHNVLEISYLNDEADFYDDGSIIGDRNLVVDSIEVNGILQLGFFIQRVTHGMVYFPIRYPYRVFENGTIHLTITR